MRYLIILFILYSSYVTANDKALTTIGWIEAVRIQPEEFDLQAKIDTGADHSSLDVISWQSFTRNNREWVRFDVRNNENSTQSFERPLERYAQIKRKKSGVLERPVVNMWLCIGNNKFLSPVNLATRKNFKYRMLIGRSYLKERFLVDSSARLTLSPECTATQ